MRPVPPPALIASGGLKCMRSRRGAARSVAAPFPARHARPAAAAAGGRPRPLPRAGASPRLLPPSLRVLVAPSPRKGSFLRPLAALALRSASRPFAPPLPSLARGSGALWCVLAPLRLGLALASGGVAGAPLPRPPPGGSLALAPPRGLLLARLAPRLLVPPSPPRGLGCCCRRCGGGASASFCFASSPGFGRVLLCFAPVRGLCCSKIALAARIPAVWHGRVSPLRKI